MSDIFISYSHKDAEFVAEMVTALKAEGFSVWWDHTIPPGKTWDEVIARGIKEAKACIIIWSAQSVISDWVKEEATLAKEGSKYLPVQVGGDLPPMGFRRIQAADLRNWHGNPQDPQWRMLINEVAILVRGSATSDPVPGPPPISAPPISAPPVSAPPVSAQPPPPFAASALSGKRGLFIGIAAGALILIVGGSLLPGTGLLSRRSPPPSEETSRDVTVPSGNGEPTEPAADGRPAAASGEGNSPRAAGTRPARASGASKSVVGIWRGWGRTDTDAPGVQYPFVATFLPNGIVNGVTVAGPGSAPYQQTGSQVVWSSGPFTWTATIDGNKMVGRVVYPQHTGTFQATR